MHGGHFSTLIEVIEHYSNPVGTPLFGHREEIIQITDWSAEDKAALVSFLEMLSSDDSSSD